MSEGRPTRITLTEREVGDLVRILSRPGLTRQLGEGARRLAEALAALAAGSPVTIALADCDALVRQPYAVDEDQRILPTAYPDGFANCPLGLVLATGSWTKGIYQAGYRTLGELGSVPLAAIPGRDAAFELSLLSARRRADALHDATETPADGYPCLPDRLCPEVPARQVLERILPYLTEENRRLVRMTFGLDCEAVSLAAAAKALQVSTSTAKSRLPTVLGTATFVFDWAGDLVALTRPGTPESEAWMLGLPARARQPLHILKEAHAWYRAKMFRDRSWVRKSFPPRPGFSPP